MPIIAPGDNRGRRRKEKMISFLAAAGATIGGALILRNPRAFMRMMAAAPYAGHAAGRVTEVVGQWASDALRFAGELAPKMEKHNVLRSIAQREGLDSVLHNVNNAVNESIEYVKRTRGVYGGARGGRFQLTRSFDNAGRHIDEVVRQRHFGTDAERRTVEDVVDAMASHMSSTERSSTIRRLDKHLNLSAVNDQSFVTIRDIMSQWIRTDDQVLKHLGFNPRKLQTFLEGSVAEVTSAASRTADPEDLQKIAKELSDEFMHHHGVAAAANTQHESINPVMTHFRKIIGNASDLFDTHTLDVARNDPTTKSANKLLDMVLDDAIVTARKLTRAPDMPDIGVVDMRSSANIIEHSFEFLRRNFRVPFIGLNPLDVIAPSSPRMMGFQAKYFGVGNQLPPTIAPYVRASAENPIAVMGRDMYQILPSGEHRLYEPPGRIKPKFMFIPDRGYTELIKSLSGEQVGRREWSPTRTFTDDLIKGTWAERVNDWLKNTLDIGNQVSPTSLQKVMGLVGNQFPGLRRLLEHPSNLYPPLIISKVMAEISGGDAVAGFNKLRPFLNAMDQDAAADVMTRYIQGAIRGPIGDTKMGTHVSQQLLDPLITATRHLGSNPDLDVGDQNFYLTALDMLQKRRADIAGGTARYTDGEVMSDIMGVLSGSRGGKIIDTAVGGMKHNEAISEFRRMVEVWSESGYNVDVAHNILQKSTKIPTKLKEGDRLLTFYDRAAMAMERAALSGGQISELNNIPELVKMGFTEADIATLKQYEALNTLGKYTSYGARRARTNEGPIEQLARLVVTGMEGKEDLGKISKVIGDIQQNSKWGAFNTDYIASPERVAEEITRYSTDVTVVRESVWNPFSYVRQRMGLTDDEWDAMGMWDKFTFGMKGMREVGVEWYRQFMPTKIDEVTSGAVVPFRIASSVAHMLDPIGMGMGPEAYQQGTGGIMGRLILNRLIPIAGAVAVYNWLDREIEATTGQGIDDRVSEQIAGHRLFMAKMRDTLGFTSVAKYMEETFPGSERISKELIGPFPGLGDVGLNIGTTESYEEMQELYTSGYVPVRSGRWWLYSKTPWGGGRISGWQPSWYARENYNIDRTPELQEQERLHSWLPSIAPGPGFNPISTFNALNDPYWKEKFFYEERPYPVTGPMFNPTSPWSTVLNPTVGQLLKPQIRMHEDELNRAVDYMSTGVAEMSTMASAEADVAGISLSSQDPFSPPRRDMKQQALTAAINASPLGMGTAAESYGGGVDILPADEMTGLERTLGNDPISAYTEGVRNPNNLLYRAGLSQYHMTELAGLRGFLFETTFGQWGTDKPVMEEFDVGSLESSWWGSNMGGGPIPFESVQETSELLRRLWPHERYQTSRLNPIRNQQPTWMPSGTEYFEDFQHGDPYGRSKVPREGLLAGPGFEQMWGDALGDDMYRGPRASMLGYDSQKQIQYFLGVDPDFGNDSGPDYAAIGDRMHARIQENLAKAGFLVESERFVRDPITGITGHIDAIADFGKGEEVVEVKTLSPRRMTNMPVGGYPEHVSQTNFYLKTQNAESGYIFYVNQQDPNDTRLVPVQFDQGRFEKDLARMRRSQTEARHLVDRGVVSPYQAYSSTARAMVLALTAPWSEEFEEEYSQALKEAETTAEKDRLKKFYNMARQMKQRKRFTPYKYIGTTPPEDTNAFERLLGGAWEAFAHMDTPLHTKFLQVRSPLEAYEREYIYGEDFGHWGRPVESWVKPTLRSVASKNPIYATIFGGVVGALFGRTQKGRMYGATIGALTGAVLSSGRAIHESVTGEQWVPKNVQKTRQIDEYFGMLEYVKWLGWYNKTGDPDALERMRRTPMGMDPYAWQSIYAVPAGERPYIRALQAEESERNREVALSMASAPARRILQAKWGMDVDDIDTDPLEYFSEHYLPPANWAGWRHDVDIEDYKVSYVDYQGLDMHDFNQWPEDLRRSEISGTDFRRNINRPRRTWGGSSRYILRVLHSLGINDAQIAGNQRKDNRDSLTIEVNRDVTRQTFSRIASGDL